MTATSSTMNASLRTALDRFGTDQLRRSSNRNSEDSQTVLFLCALTSVRSVMAKAILNHLAGGRFRALSAGSYPSGPINPLALACLAAHGIPTAGLRGKGWCELVGLGAPKTHFIIALCKEASTEQMTSLPWHTPQYAHWDLPDPTLIGINSTERRQAFEKTFQLLTYRIEQFLTLPFDQLSPAALTQELSVIGALPFSLIHSCR